MQSLPTQLETSLPSIEVLEHELEHPAVDVATAKIGPMARDESGAPSGRPARRGAERKTAKRR